MPLMRSRLSGTRRTDGRWQITLTLTDENGAKFKKTIYGDSQRECQDSAALVKKNGLPKKSPLLEVIWFDFIVSHVDPLALKTQAYYKWTGTRIVAHYGKKKPSEIRPQDVRQWLDKMALEGVGGRSIQMHRNCLRVFLGWCRERGLIDQDNAASGVRLPIKTKPQARASLTRAMARLIRIYEPDTNYRLMWRVLEETGMRPSEALRLHGQDITYSKGVAILAVRGTKTEQAVRQVPITIALAALIPIEGKVFAMDQFRVQKRWKAAMERASIPYTNLYQLRKLCLSEWARRGIPPEVLKTWAGHSDIALTQNVYVRVQRKDVLNALKTVGLSKHYVNPLVRDTK